MQVAADYSKIILEASLVKGKMYSSIVRTLYPDSRVTIYLPNQGIIAGVRGTEFSINLDAGYIHSIDHSVTLQNKLFQKVTLLPGQVVSSADIFTQFGIEMIDHIWEDAVNVKDETYKATHSQEVSATWQKISGKFFEYNIWDEFVRSILKNFSAFDDLKIFETLTFHADELSKNSAEELMALYQKFKF